MTDHDHAAVEAALLENVRLGYMEFVGVDSDGEMQYRLTDEGIARVEQLGWTTHWQPVVLRVGPIECHLGDIATVGWPRHLAALLRDAADQINTIANRRDMP